MSTYENLFLKPDFFRFAYKFSQNLERKVTEFKSVIKQTNKIQVYIIFATKGSNYFM